jgi:hypothetical protein
MSAPELEACGWYVRTKRTAEDSAGWLVADCSSTPHGAEYARLFAASPKLLKAAQGLLRIATRNDVTEQEQLEIAEAAIEAIQAALGKGA